MLKLWSRCLIPTLSVGAALAALTLVASCRTVSSGEASESLAASNRPDPKTDPGTMTLRAPPGALVCISRAFTVDTSRIYDPDAPRATTTEKTMFTVDESNVSGNAYWMAIAANFAYLDEGVVRTETKELFGSIETTWFEGKSPAPAVDTQAYLANIAADPKRTITVDEVDSFDPSKAIRVTYPSVGDMGILAFRGTDLRIMTDIYTDLRDGGVPLTDGKGHPLAPDGHPYMELRLADDGRVYNDKAGIEIPVLMGPYRWYGLTHQGFQQAIDIVWDKIVTQVRALHKPLWVTGHSLGAGLATVATARLLALHDPSIHIMALYTFGSPRAGQQDFVDSMNADLKGQGVKLRRYVNRDDLVVMIPAQISGLLGGSLRHLFNGGWRHIGFGTGGDDVLTWWATQRTPYSNEVAKGRMSTTAWSLPLGKRMVGDHAIVEYVGKLELTAFRTRTQCDGTKDPTELR